MAKAAKQLVICIDNTGYEVSLERRKIYVAVPDAAIPWARKESSRLDGKTTTSPADKVVSG